MSEEKIRTRLEAVEKAALSAAGSQEAISVLADCEKALKRAAKRAETLLGEYERVEIKQSRGPTLEFTGRLLCDDELETRGHQPLKITMEIWETRGGAMVAATYSEPIGRAGYEDCRATVVERDDDPLAMRMAVMEHFGWETRARSMVTKKLKWSFRIEVE